ADYYRPVGLDRAVAVPLWMDGRTLVSLVLNRRGPDFSDRDCARLELLRPHLSFLYRLAFRARAGEPQPGAQAMLRPRRAGPLPAGLTPREREVVHWLAHGKTDAEIAAVLGTSRRTVQKHLEHVYVKLGVETRTAAVMRALALRPPDGTPLRHVAEARGAAAPAPR
ncbi:MAG TPA: LuxR C-terminal-related transcriptional regulator, partial [Ramlibacter sp.]|nr:LuxR C-terminal-related transcriptional regulator [Ramlibacter sp.]